MHFEFRNLQRVLIANRGEIACRLIKACKENGLFSVAIFTKDDSKSAHITEADDAYLLPGEGASGYIDVDAIIAIARESGAQAVIPGYGFLSENQQFASELEKHGIAFAGPSPAVINEFGLKHIARSLAIKAKVPTVPGSGLINEVSIAEQEAEKIGYPVLLKASAGGGGVGMKVCHDRSEISAGLAEVKSRSSSLFKNDSIFLEKYVQNGRHIEVQVFGNGLGDVLVLGERECSIQRRHQKVIEEAPSPFIAKKDSKHRILRDKLSECAHSLASSVRYKSAGTIAFLVDDETGDYYFLEMNTRLQVEHGITELTYGVDLVTLMLLQTEYEIRGQIGIPKEVLMSSGSFEVENGWAQPHGHAIEVRIYAENPVKKFAPAPGILQYVSFPEMAPKDCKFRVDHWIKTGTEITPFFDPLLAKLMVWGPTRVQAMAGMLQLLKDTQIHGPPNNIEYLASIIAGNQFQIGDTLTSNLDNFEYTPCMLEFTSAGALTTVQDFPGRIAYNGGIPKGGPLDDLAFRIGNVIIGNEPGTEGLEIVFSGPTLRFHSAATIAVTGAPFEFKINGKFAPMWSSISIPSNSEVEIGKSLGISGDKAYLLIKGGLPNIATYLGSKSTSPAINIGGYQGRKFVAGDCISLGKHREVDQVCVNYTLPKSFIPGPDELEPGQKESEPGPAEPWVVRCLNGPHSSDEIMGEAGRAILYGCKYTINANTTRGSTALDGEKCVFARAHGGDGGNHPSNIIEYIYPYRGLSIIADNTVVAGPDGITLSGFVCPIVPVEADWWKLGQAKVGSSVVFQNVTYDDALRLQEQRNQMLETIKNRPETGNFQDQLQQYEPTTDSDVILFHRDAAPGMPMLNVRQAGESAIIIDHGVTSFSLANCGRLYKMKMELGTGGGIRRIEPANGSMTVFFDPFQLSRSKLLARIEQIDSSISFNDELIIPSRKFRLPVSMDHPLIEETIRRYMQNQRPSAAYLPSNLKYVMESSCIPTLEEFKSRAFNSPQVILAVSFLCASNLMVHVDPRKSFVSGKYNPPRIWGPAGSVTTGSVVQGMRAVDGPGGYMLWGIGLRHAFWDTYAMRDNFTEMPWFLQPFDQVEFYEVSNQELDTLNELNRIGRHKLEYEATVFDVKECYEFQESVKEEVTSLRERQAEATAKLLAKDNEMKKKWEEEVAARKAPVETVAVSGVPVLSPMAANLFKINVKKGDLVKGGDVAVVLEAMKTEISVAVPTGDYKVLQVLVEEKSMVMPEDTIVVLESIEAVA